MTDSRQQMGITILTAAVQTDMMRAWLQLSGTKAQDTAVSEIHDCNTKTNLDMSFSYTDEEKKACACDTMQKRISKT